MLIRADARRIPLADGSVQCCVTSPPYWSLRDYGLEPSIFGGDPECEHVWGDELPHNKGTGGHNPKQDSNNIGSWQGDETTQGSFCRLCNAWRGCLGLEPTPELYVEHMVEVVREVRRVLRDDGTCWLNLGDSYAGSGKGRMGDGTIVGGVKQQTNWGSVHGDMPTYYAGNGLKPKDLVGIPWRVAFALQADGWWLRSDIIWHKPNPMPESVTDRPTKSHEYLFLLTKSKRYFYDAEAIKEQNKWPDHNRFGNKNAAARMVKELTGNMKSDAPEFTSRTGRNKRTVWTIPTRPYSGAHFATYPPALVEPCILAGSYPGSVVLDPFCGSGTTGMVAIKHGREFVGLDLNGQYLSELAIERTDKVQLAMIPT